MKRYSVIIVTVIISLHFTLAANVQFPLEVNDNDQEAASLTERQLNRLVMLNYEKSYRNFLRRNMSYSPMKGLPWSSFRLSSLESKLRFSFLPDMKRFTDPIIDFIDYIPYEEYFIFIDNYYLNDIKIITFGDWADLRINLKDMTRGDYFMKLNIDLFRSMFKER